MASALLSHNRVHAIAVYSTVVLTIGLVIARPRVGAHVRVGILHAAAFGLLVLALLGAVRVEDVLDAASTMWRPVAALIGLMLTTAAAERMGMLEWMASLAEAHARGSALRLFVAVFVLGALTAAILNNDSAILLLTPLVAAIARRRHTANPAVLRALVFAVFTSTGIAPLVISNPMNMVVASHAGIGFNEYAATMAPIAAAAGAASFLALFVYHHGTLARALPAARAGEVARPPPFAAIAVFALLVASLIAHPLIAHLGGATWLVALATGAAALLLAHGFRRATAVALVRRGIAWDVLGFLFCIALAGMALRNVGLVEHLEDLYDQTGMLGVGLASAIGSAVLNNHPMAILNVHALAGASERGLVFAAMIGGDLGPRLLPIGSLAGLLWLELLRRRDVGIGLAEFVRCGLVTAVPALAVALALLALAHP